MDKFLKRSARPSTSGHETFKKNRLYSEEYLKYGFTVISDNKPQCVICYEVLSRESMKPSKLQRHLTTKHSQENGKPLEFFQRKLKYLQYQKKPILHVSSLNEKALLASYKVAFRLAKAGKPHTIAENLILPAAVDMVQILIGEKESAKLKTIPLSDNTMQRRICEIAEDVRNQILDKVRECTYFSLQLDESTDISNCSQFVVFIRYDTKEAIEEDILFCKALETNTTGKCLFEKFVESTSEYHIDWEKCIAICSDGAKALTGCKTGLIKRLKSIMPNATWQHCFLHRQALAAKSLPMDLNSVLNTIIKAVNYIKGKALQTRTFRKLCESMDSLYENLLYHTEVRWLSRGKMLTRVFELRAELLMYFQTLKSEYAEFFSNPLSLLKLAYLADVFDNLNILNKSLQGFDENIITASDKINGFLKKASLWSTSLKQRNFASFPCIDRIMDEISIDNTVNVELVFSEMQVALQDLRGQLLEYFPEETRLRYDDQRWVVNPFLERSVELTRLPIKLKENLIDISTDGMLKLEFSSQRLDKFWMNRKKECPELANEALKVLIPFVTSYLCELTYSSMVALKTKYRNRLELENDLLVCVTNTEPRFVKLVEGKQAHQSH